MSETLAKKYRPLIFEDVIGNEQNAKILKEASRRKQFPQAVLFAGTHGSGKCISRNTLVLTEEGLISGDYLIGTHPIPYDTFIDKNIKVMNLDGELEPADKLYFNGRTPTKLIKFDDGHLLEATYEHPLFLATKSFKKTADLKKNDKVMCYFNTNIFKLNELALSDIREDRELADFAANFHLLEQKILSNRDLQIYFIYKLNWKVLNQDNHFFFVLRGSKWFLNSLQTILLNLGFFTYLVHGVNDSYISLEISGALNRFKSLFNGNLYLTELEIENLMFRETYTRSILINPKYFNSERIYGNVFYRSVVSVTEVEEPEITYDLHVPGSHTFIADSIVNHNTSMGRILGRAISCQHPKEDGNPCNECDNCKAILNGNFPDYIELDAASENSVNDIRAMIKSINYLPTLAENKVIMLDECLPGDTVVATDNGLVTMSEIYHFNMFLVNSFGKNNQYERPINPFKRETKSTIKLKSVFGTFECTPTHNLPVYNNKRIFLKKAEDITTEDYLVTTKIHLPETVYWTLSEQTVALSAFLFTATERIKKENSNKFIYNRGYGRKYAEFVLSFLKENEAQISYTDTSIQIEIDKTPESLQMERYDCFTRKNKLIFILYSLLFNGFRMSGNRGIALKFKNSILAKEIQFILMDLGLYPKVVDASSTSEYYSLKIVGVYRKKLIEKFQQLNCSIFLKQALVDKFGDVILDDENDYSLFYYQIPQELEECCYNIPRENIFIAKVQDIQTEVKQIDVYDFTISENHNFMANGILTSNCHMLSQQASNAFLKTLEEPPPFVKFILATTEIHKILDTIKSRCLIFTFKDIQIKDIKKRLDYIVSKENINIEDFAVDYIAKHSNGSMRDSIMLLDQAQLMSQNEQISVKDIMALVGSVSLSDLITFIGILKEASDKELFEWLDSHLFSPQDIVNSVLSFLEIIMFIKQGASPLSFVSKDKVPAVAMLATKISSVDVSHIFNAFKQFIYDTRNLNFVNKSTMFKLHLLSLQLELKGTNFIPISSQSQEKAQIKETLSEFEKFKKQYKLTRVTPEAIFV